MLKLERNSRAKLCGASGLAAAILESKAEPKLNISDFDGSLSAENKCFAIMEGKNALALEGSRSIAIVL